MAFAGSSNGVLRSTGKPLPASFQNAHTACGWVRSSASPSTTSGFDVAFGSVGGVNQAPQANMHWDHAATQFAGAWAWRDSSLNYFPAKFAALPANTWLHLTATFDGTRARVYLDGVLDGVSGLCSVGVSATAYAYILGAIDSNGNYDTAPTAFPTGQVAEVGFWDTVLTADEIAALAKGFRPHRVRPASLQAYFPAVRSPIEVKKGGATVVNGSLVVSDHPRVFG